jgi:hypothetical protein
MKISVSALCLWINVAAQSGLKKQGISIAQQMPASSLDAQMPNRPFADWSDEVVGRGAGVVWQSSECGGPASGVAEQDLSACAEASVLLEGLVIKRRQSAYPMMAKV